MTEVVVDPRVDVIGGRSWQLGHGAMMSRSPTTCTMVGACPIAPTAG
jgi:hypothetical protein